MDVSKLQVLFNLGSLAEDCPKTAGIYYWRNNIDGKGYVGETVSFLNRMKQYRCLRVRKQPKLFDAIKLTGIWNFTCYKLMDCCPNKLALHHWEMYWVAELQTFGDGGYNCTPGGHSMGNDTPIKISMALKGRKKPPITEEHRRNISKAKLGCTHKSPSVESRQRISAARIGMQFTEEHRRHIGDVQRGKKKAPRTANHQANLWRSRRLNNGTLWKDFFVFD